MRPTLLVASIVSVLIFVLTPAKAAGVEKPAHFVDTSVSATPSNGTVREVRPSSNPDNNCAALQLAIDQAVPGDVISVLPGIYRCDALRLRNKIGDGWITIKSSNTEALLPPPGNRISPTDHPNMPVIISRGSNAAAIRTDSGAHNYRLIGLEITKLDPTSYVQELVIIDADQNVGQTQVADLADFPRDIIVDRCYIHGLPANDLKRGVRLYCFNCAVIDSYISEAHVVGQEAQAILFGGGPLKIANNYLEAAGENLFAADFLSLRTAHVSPVTRTTATLTSTSDLHVGDPMALYDGTTSLFTHVLSINDLTVTYENLPAQPSATSVAYWGTLPTDIDVYNNHLYKQLSWKADDTSYTGYHPTVKNLFELKSGRRVWFHNNVLEHNWIDGQDGTAILLTVRNQYNQCYFCTVENITLENNIVVGAFNGVSVLHTDNLDKSGPTQNVSISNNLFYGLTNVFHQGSIDNETINHNTISVGGYALSVENGAVRSLNSYTNNIVVSKWASGVHYNDGNVPDWGIIFPKLVMRDNVFTARGLPTFLYMPTYKATNYDVNSPDDIGFVDWKSDNFALGQSSFARRAALDGTDLGADVADLLQKRANIVSGTNVSPQPNPPAQPTPPVMNAPYEVYEQRTSDSWTTTPGASITTQWVESNTCSVSLRVDNSIVRERAAVSFHAMISGTNPASSVMRFVVDGRSLGASTPDPTGDARFITRQLHVGSHVVLAEAESARCVSQPVSVLVIPIPDQQTTFTLDPLVLADSQGMGKLAVHWNAPSVSQVEVRVGAPDGQLFAAGVSSGSAETGAWVTNGILFFLQVAGTTDPNHTLAVARARATTAQLAGTLSISPDPIFARGLYGSAQLTWSASAVTAVEIHVGSPDGPLFARGGSSGTAVTGQWVSDGTTFFLQDRSNAQNPLTAAYTIATATAQVLPFPEKGYLFVTPLQSERPGHDLATLTWASSTAEKVEIHFGTPDGPLFASGGPQGTVPVPGWARSGQVFFAQDVTQSDQPLSFALTIATQTVDLSADPNVLFQASPNPMVVTPDSALGSTTVYWNVPGMRSVEIHVGTPDGPLLARGGLSGAAPISGWGQEGTLLFLIDVSSSASNKVLGTLTLHVARTE